MPSASEVSAPVGPVPALPTITTANRFYRPPDWRYVIADLDSVSVTFLDRIASDRIIEFDLNTPTTISGVVKSSEPEVNILHTDGDPFLAEGNRLLYAFRREGDVAQPWVIRAAGKILEIQDEGNPDISRSRFTAIDPWGELYMRQCRNLDGELPGEPGLIFTNEPVGEIALELLRRTIQYAGTVHLDAGVTWGGEINYDGFIADTEPIDYNVQRGKTVGEVWEDLCATGLMDIEITPVYDIDDRPGYVGEPRSTRSLPTRTSRVASRRHNAIFAWDKPPRTLAGITRTIDGRRRGNWLQFYTRYGNLAADVLEDAAAQAKYGQYEYVQFFPDQINVDRVAEWSTAQLDLRKRGIRSVTPLPSQQQPPLLWHEFFVGDLVPVYASDRLRERIPDADAPDVYQRVYGITINLTDPDAFEVISDLRVSQDGITT